MIRTSARSLEPREGLGLTVVGVIIIGVLVITLFVQQSMSPWRRGTDSDITASDGYLPDGATVFDREYAGIAELDPALLRALREAAADAADDDVEFQVNSGWRSIAYQKQLLREAIAEHGSEAEAERWVATPARSPHVSGNAVDLGVDARTWLSEHGASYGLCQIFENEPWHYELRRDAIRNGCPAMQADPTQDR